MKITMPESFLHEPPAPDRNECEEATALLQAFVASTLERYRHLARDRYIGGECISIMQGELGKPETDPARIILVANDEECRYPGIVFRFGTDGFYGANYGVYPEDPQTVQRRLVSHGQFIAEITQWLNNGRLFPGPEPENIFEPSKVGREEMKSVINTIGTLMTKAVSSEPGSLRLISENMYTELTEAYYFPEEE